VALGNRPLLSGSIEEITNQYSGLLSVLSEMMPPPDASVTASAICTPDLYAHLTDKACVQLMKRSIMMSLSASIIPKKPEQAVKSYHFVSMRTAEDTVVEI
jgi:hypothetical protein